MCAGGYITDITFKDIFIQNASSAIDVSMFYSDHRLPTNKSATPVFGRLTFINISGTDVVSPGMFTGLPESPINTVSLKDVHFPTPHSWQCSDTVGLVQTDVSPPIKC